MAITEENRHHLYTRLEQVLGHEEATVLMEHLPPVGWADVATKRDLEHLEIRIDARFAAVDARFDAVDARFDAVEARIESELGALELRLGSALDRRLADFTRTMVFAVFAAQATFAGLVVAILG